MPGIVCGDFNDEPGSSCYNLMTSGRFSSAYKSVNGQEPLFTTFKDYKDGLKKRTIDYASYFLSLFILLLLFLNFPFLSFYFRVSLSFFFLISFLFVFVDLSYIFYTPSTLGLESVLEMIPDTLLPNKLPSHDWPSDHISLQASFSFSTVN